MQKVLIVDTDHQFLKEASEYLSAQSFKLDFAYNGLQAVHLLGAQSFDLIILNKHLPKIDGVALCNRLQRDGLTYVPSIILSNDKVESDAIKVFKAGAWDYVSKPINFDVLSARMKVALKKLENNKVLNYKFLRLDEASMSVSIEHKYLQLSPIGFSILAKLVAHAPNVVKAQEMIDDIWQDEVPMSNPLRAHVYILKKQLMSVVGYGCITNVKGIGYKLTL